MSHRQGGGQSSAGGLRRVVVWRGRELSFPASPETAHGSRWQIHVRRVKWVPCARPLGIMKQKGTGRAGTLLHPAAPLEAHAALHMHGK